MAKRNCSLGKCENRISTDVIKCYACKLDFHTQCYGVVATTAKAVNNNNNLLFLCDNCLTVAHPVSLVSFASEVTQLKSSVGNMASAMSAHTAQLAPSAVFEGMLTSLNEINVSLKSLNEDREAASEQDAEAHALLNGIKATLTRVEAQKPPEDSSELLSLLKDVRAALREENRTLVPNQNSASMPFKFGEIISRKRRNGQPNGVGTPVKRTRQQQTICTGQQDAELIAVAPLQQPIESGKSLVASRFAPTTSSSMVLDYVKRNLSLEENSDEVSVRSLVPRGRQLSELTFVSFKVTATDEIYAKLMDPTFWPNNATIREFEIREKPTATVFA